MLCRDDWDGASDNGESSSDDAALLGRPLAFRVPFVLSESDGTASEAFFPCRVRSLGVVPFSWLRMLLSSKS